MGCGSIEAGTSNRGKRKREEGEGKKGWAVGYGRFLSRSVLLHSFEMTGFGFCVLLSILRYIFVYVGSCAKACPSITALREASRPTQDDILCFFNLWLS